MSLNSQRGRKEQPVGESTPLGRAIRAWRNERNMSLTQLAEKAGFENTMRSYLSKLEHGQIRRPHESQVRRIAEALGISPFYLMLGVLPSDKDLSNINKVKALQITLDELDALRRELNAHIARLESRVIDLLRSQISISDETTQL